MKVVHITPTYFDPSSVIGGGERYPTELALAMSKFVDTTLVSFSLQRRSYKIDQLQVEIYPVKSFLQNNQTNAFNWQYLSKITQADIVHTHGMGALAPVIAALYASVLGKKIIGIDHGGGSGLGWWLNEKAKITQRYHYLTAQSDYALMLNPREIQKKIVVIKGGIDLDRFSMIPHLVKNKTILYIGRILPHKGINYLVDAFRLLNAQDYTLKIIGRVYSDRFYTDLKQLAAGLSVEFIHNADDQTLLQEYQKACVTVLPSVHTDCYGNYTPVPELMGLTLLESQACGTPVVCTDAGAMHEFVDHEQTGFVVAQNSGEAIAEALHKIINLSTEEYTTYQTECQGWITQFGWSEVVKKHLALYQDQRF